MVDKLYTMEFVLRIFIVTLITIIILFFCVKGFGIIDRVLCYISIVIYVYFDAHEIFEKTKNKYTEIFQT